MTVRGRKWQLLRDGVIFADIEQTDTDFPWLYGTLTPRVEFAQYATLFAAAQKFLDRDEFDTPESDAAFKAIFDLGLSIRDVDDNEMFDEVMINLDGTEASWRC